MNGGIEFKGGEGGEAARNSAFKVYFPVKIRSLNATSLTT